MTRLPRLLTSVMLAVAACAAHAAPYSSLIVFGDSVRESFSTGVVVIHTVWKESP